MITNAPAPTKNSPIHQDEMILNVAATCPATRVLGPGLRAVIWVQGCPFRCPGCIAPDWVSFKPERLIPPDRLAYELLENPAVTGLTFSGGEPMVQAAALARLARTIRSLRDVNIICFTGYNRQQLEQQPPFPGIRELLDQVDVLIDGPYIARLNDNQGLRGSSNQKIHYLSERLVGCDLEHIARRAEIYLQNGEAMMVGVPPLRLGTAFNQAVDQVRNSSRRFPDYERI